MTTEPTSGPPADLPEAAVRRLGSGSFSSGLSVPDFAACLQMGLRPVGLVQGFCVMSSGWYGAGSPYGRGVNPYAPAGGTYSESWRCPHGFVSMEHRTWGQNYQQPWVESSWSTGFGSAHARMVEEAREAGAHGVVGVVDRTRQLTDAAVTEHHLLGTAVVLVDEPLPGDLEPFTTYLAGQRLAKLVEAGYVPVSVVASLASVRVWASCITEMLMEGLASTWGSATGSVQEVEQVSRAHEAVRTLAREDVRRQLGPDMLHGASIAAVERELGAGDLVVDCTLRGTRVRRFKDFDPMPPPRPTVRLT